MHSVVNSTRVRRAILLVAGVICNTFETWLSDRKLVMDLVFCSTRFWHFVETIAQRL